MNYQRLEYRKEYYLILENNTLGVKQKRFRETNYYNYAWNQIYHECHENCVIEKCLENL